MARGEGERLGRYRLVRRLGAGGMAEVWEATDESLRRRVAVKILRFDPDDRELAEARFAREAQAAAALRHPNVVVVHDVGEEQGQRFLVMELVLGKSLRELVGAKDVPIEDRARWIAEVARALAAVHDKGIIHRDVKPENVIIRTDGTACLVDLGIAKFSDDSRAATLDPRNLARTEENIVVGTPDYLPPEARTAGVHDALGDQWAWATLGYELLTGVHPRDVGDRALADRDDLPADLRRTIDRARSTKREARFGSMAEVVGALGGGAATLSRHEKKASKTTTPRTSPLAIAAMSAAAVLVIGGAGFALALVTMNRAPSPERSAPVAPTLDAEPPDAGETSDTTEEGPVASAAPSASVKVAAPHRFHVKSMYITPKLEPDLDAQFKREYPPRVDACISSHPPRCPLDFSVTCKTGPNGDLEGCDAHKARIFTGHLDRLDCATDAFVACLAKAVHFRVPVGTMNFDAHLRVE